MKIFISIFLLCWSTIIYAIDFNLKDNVRGYLESTYIHTQGSEFFTNGYIALGLNLNYEINNRIFFSTQITSRNPIESNFPNDVYSDNLFLEYILFNINLFNFENSQHNLLFGRVKIPYGFYNETRDTPNTKPSIILPQSVYIEKLRDFALSADGFIYNYTRFNKNYNIEANFGAGKTIIDDLTVFNFYPTLIDIIELEPDYSYITNLSINSNDLRYRLKYSYLETDLNSTNFPTSTNFKMNVFSFQYNYKKWSWTNEYAHANSTVSNNFGIGAKSDAWYTQLEYFFNPKLTILGRYESTIAHPKLKLLPTNTYSAISLNLKYKITDNLTFNTFVSRNIGTMPLLPVSIMTREPLDINRHWDLFMFSLDYSF